MSYFSERVEGRRPQEREEICENALGGIQALICARIEDGSFGAKYPKSCWDCEATIGTDVNDFLRAMQADIPTLQDMQNPPWNDDFAENPRQTLDILDMIEFCWECVRKPINAHWHESHKHYILEFDEAGQDEFCNRVNRIFRRNGLAYKLTEQGRFEHVGTPVLREELASAQFDTGDVELDSMLHTAKSKYFSPDQDIRYEGLAALWDAWERLKTLDSELDKKTQITLMLDQTAGSISPKFCEALKREAKELTWIGNNLQIRHSETGQEKLSKSEHADYLFHRLFCLVQVILRCKQ